MTWQEACAKSKIGNAYRDTDDHRHIVKHSDGSASVLDTASEFGIRLADPKDIEGFDDWKPV